MYAAFLYKVERSALKHCLELTLHAVDVVSLVLQEIAHPVLDRFEVDVAGLRDTQARDLGCSLENLRLCKGVGLFFLEATYLPKRWKVRYRLYRSRLLQVGTLYLFAKVVVIRTHSRCIRLAFCCTVPNSNLHMCFFISQIVLSLFFARGVLEIRSFKCTKKVHEASEVKMETTQYERRLTQLPW